MLTRVLVLMVLAGFLVVACQPQTPVPVFVTPSPAPTAVVSAIPVALPTVTVTLTEPEATPVTMPNETPTLHPQIIVVIPAASDAPSVQPAGSSATTATPCAPTDEGCNRPGTALNPNANFDQEAVTLPQAEIPFDHPDGRFEVIRHTVQVPGPPFQYEWDFALTAQNGMVEIPGWIPDVFAGPGRYMMNLTGASGTALLVANTVPVEADTAYTAELDYTPRLELVDPAQRYAITRQAWQGLCWLRTDTGQMYSFEPQPLSEGRTSWSENRAEQVRITFVPRRDMAVTVACGLRLKFPLWNGDVWWTGFRIMPVDRADSAAMREIF